MNGKTPRLVTELFMGAGLAHRGIQAAWPDARCVGYDFNEDAVASATSNGINAGWVDLSHPTTQQVVVDRQLPDLLWASPPCQGFSTMGSKLGAADPRNGFSWVLDMLGMYRRTHGRVPARLIFENVKGMAQHRGGRRAPCRHGKLPDPLNCSGCYLEEVCTELRSSYAHVEWRVLDAADFGVPQHRRRLFIQCSQRPIVWPTPSHGPQRSQPWVTMSDVLPHLDADHPGWSLDGGRNFANHPRQERPVSGDEPAPAVSTRGNQVIRWEGGKRRLTVEEVAVLQGVDDPTLTSQPKKYRYQQIGNGVPPALVRAIVESE